MDLLESKGLTENQIGNYRSIIAAFLNVTEKTQPGTAARERIMRDIMSGTNSPTSTRPSSAVSRIWSSLSVLD